MLERARAAGVPFAWLAGDSVYGAGSALWAWAERHRRGCVLAATSGQRLGQRPVTAWIEDPPGAAWQWLSAGEGVKEPRLHGWAHLPYNGGAEGSDPPWFPWLSHALILVANSARLLR